MNEDRPHREMRFSGAFITLLAAALSLLVTSAQAQNADPNAVFQQHTTSDGSKITERHESGSLVINNKLYAFGGRQMKPVEFFDPVTNNWTTLGTPPYEINHFQPVLHNGKVYAIGAFECCYPDEVIHPEIKLYDVATDTWSDGPAIPANRLRGSAGAVKYNNKIYIVGGNTQGHSGGAVAWFDEFDPATNSWQTLPDAPTARDHFFAVLVGNKLVAASGRQSSLPNPFTNTISAVDVYDFSTGQWSSVSAIPTDRAGAMAVKFGEEAIYIGGETATMSTSNTEVEAFNPLTGVWRALQPLMMPTHTGVAGVLGDDLHVITGSDVVGGGGENDFHQVAELDDGIPDALDADADGLTDTDEDNVYNTNRLKADTDGDGLSDGIEVNVHNSDPNKTDSDNDGLDDFDEASLGTDLNDVDTDSDGLSDGDEVSEHETDPLKRDSDGDFLPDDHEINIHNTDPNDADSDNDGLSDSDEINDVKTDPLDDDTDNDGLSDWAEVNTHNTDPLIVDTDTDGADDGQEIAAGLNPLFPDTDGDGISDGDELNGTGDSGSGNTDTSVDSSGDSSSGSENDGTVSGDTDGDGTDSGSGSDDAGSDNDEATGNEDTGSEDTGSEDTGSAGNETGNDGSAGGTNGESAGEASEETESTDTAGEASGTNQGGSGGGSFSSFTGLLLLMLLAGRRAASCCRQFAN